MSRAGAGFRGNPHVIRLSASQLDLRPEQQCQAFAAVKARPQLWPAQYEPRRYAPWESFPLGTVMAALNLVEFEGVEVEEAATRSVAGLRFPLHPGAVAWVRRACARYLDGVRWLDEELTREGVVLLPEENPRVVQSGSAVEHRLLAAWGRWYESADGRVREFRRLRLSRSGSAEDPSTLAFAFVAGTGLQAVSDVYGEIPVQVRHDEVAAIRIRVTEVLLSTDRLPAVLVNAPVEEVQRSYRDQTRHRAVDLTAGRVRVAGRDCAGCKLQGTCDALLRIPGLLGLSDRGTHRRTWSVSTSRYYQVCPAQAHLRELHLPGRSDTDSPASRRGRVVHEWLQLAHEREPHRPCTAADLPDPDAAEIGHAGSFMTRQEYREARPYLVQHLSVCPLNGSATDVEPEPKIAVYDPDADVIVIANPDLIRRANGITFYREHKTSSRRIEATPEQALKLFPQLALAVCLLDGGAFSDHPTNAQALAPGIVELEVMTPVGADVLTYDAADPTIVSAARRVVTERVRDWHRDIEFRARPGRWCSACPAAEWCPDASSSRTDTSPINVDGILVDPRTGEVLSSAAIPSPRAHALSATISEPDLDDEPPF